MFQTTYSFGKVKIHPVVIDEIDGWIRRDNSKCKKFTKQILETIVVESIKYSSGLKQPTDQQRTKGINAISAIESKADASTLGAVTSRADKELLLSAHINSANLATQERTLTTVAKRSLGETRVFSFEDMVIDLSKSGVLGLA